MVRLLEAKGVRVFSLAEECLEVDAFSFWRGNRPLVFLNTMKSAEHSRFDAAHELGHLVLHPHGQPNGRQAEREANTFAGAFLMPRSSLLAYAPRSATLPDLIRAKSIWKVSPAALAYRMREAGILSEWYYRALCVEIQKFGYRQVEPNGQPRELSLVLEKVFAELRNDGISKMDVARELGWPLRELHSVVFQLVVTVATGGGRSQPRKKPHPPSDSSVELMG
jgi:Zn-dependent peptidase ImmA (M78 family)